MKTLLLLIYSMAFLVITGYTIVFLFSWPYDHKVLLISILFISMIILYFPVRKFVSREEKAYEFMLFLNNKNQQRKEKDWFIIKRIPDVESYLNHLNFDQEIHNITIVSRVKWTTTVEHIIGIVFASNIKKAEKMVGKWFVKYSN